MAQRIDQTDVVREPLPAFLPKPEGQERVVSFVHRLAASPPQVLLLEGGSPDQRLGMGLYWAALLNCVDDNPPCLECSTCRQIQGRSYRDLYLFSGMEEAIKIARKYENMKIICQNVFTVPGGYHYSGKTYDEFAEIMKENAKKEYAQFMSNIDHEGIALEVVYSLDTNDNPVTDIIDFAQEHQPSAIIIGVKGRTSTTALFIGSRAEQLVQYNSKIPMMVVRPKGKNAGIIDLLKEI